jgi:hypothetical protein
VWGISSVRSYQLECAAAAMFQAVVTLKMVVS